MSDICLNPSENESNSTINVSICPATGGQFKIQTNPDENIQDLRRKIARHLQTPKDRLKLLFREKELSHGTIADNTIQDGSKIFLLPSVESGFSSMVQGTQQSIIQAIENLSDVQIDDFLSGRSPLTLALRVGDHMMFVQLQLEQALANQNASLPSGESGRHRISRSHRRQQFNYSQMAGNSRRYAPGPSCGEDKQTRPYSVYSSLAAPIHQQNAHAHSSAPQPHVDPKTTQSGPVKRGPEPALPHPSEKVNHLDKLAAFSSLGAPSAPKRKKIVTSSKLADVTSSQKTAPAASSKEAGPEVGYRPASTTSGKITSGVGPLTHHGSTSSTGAKVVRQIQRLRRLCGVHQQCVAYSSRELASEVSSIVNAAKHHSQSESGGSYHHHRRSGKTSQRSKLSAPVVPPRPSSTPSSSRPTVAGASIDSFTTHGPGIFSGTFSGSLHPNIQDHDGRPKRDPQTILQILTDLLSATNQYQGQTGNIGGILPQLLKDHFTKIQAASGSSASPSISKTPATSSAQESRSSSSSSRHLRSGNRTPHHHHHHHHSMPPMDPAHYMTSRAFNYPYLPQQGGISPPPSYAACQQSMSGYDWGSAGPSNGIVLPPYIPTRHYSNSSMTSSRSSMSSSSSSSSSSRRCCKQRAPYINVPRLKQLQQENYTTRKKVFRLKEKMLLRKMERQYRRTRNQLRPGLSQEVVAEDKPNDVNNALHRTAADEIKASNLELQLDDLSSFAADDRKAEVTHESPETVTV